MNFTKLFKRKPKILALNWSDPLQARKVASHRVLQINNEYFYRKDEVERLMQEVIDLKVRNGELAVVIKNDKLKIKNG
jgi:hypothetical protein